MATRTGVKPWKIYEVPPDKWAEIEHAEALREDLRERSFLESTAKRRAAKREAKGRLADAEQRLEELTPQIAEARQAADFAPKIRRSKKAAWLTGLAVPLGFAAMPVAVPVGSILLVGGIIGFPASARRLLRLSNSPEYKAYYKATNRHGSNRWLVNMLRKGSVPRYRKIIPMLLRRSPRQQTDSAFLKAQAEALDAAYTDAKTDWTRANADVEAIKADKLPSQPDPNSRWATQADIEFVRVEHHCQDIENTVGRKISSLAARDGAVRYPQIEALGPRAGLSADKKAVWDWAALAHQRHLQDVVSGGRKLDPNYPVEVNPPPGKSTQLRNEAFEAIVEARVDLGLGPDHSVVLPNDIALAAGLDI